MHFTRRRVAAAVLLALPVAAHATPFSIFEARGFAMGGAGVASSEYAAASLYNPALLAVTSDSQRVSFILPAVGARAAGNDGAIDAVKNLNDNKSIDSLTSAADAFQTAFNTCSANGTAVAGCENNTALRNASTRVADTATAVKNELTALSGKSYNVNAGAVAAIALPKWEYKGALSMNVEFFGKATPTIASNDLNEFNAVVSGARAYATTGQTSNLSSFVDANGNINVGRNNNDYQSNFKVVGVAIANFGLSMAKAIQVGDHGLLVGVTPKLQQVSTVAYTANVDSADFELNKNKKTATGFNLDVGVAKTFDAGSPYENVRLGMTVRNLIPRTYKTTDPTQDIKLAPQVRVGAAWVGKYGAVTSDLDLTSNKAVGTGTDASQIWAIGGELNAWNVAKLRLGYRQDMKAKYSAITTGVSLFGLQVSAAYSQDRELGVMAQFGATF